MSETKTEEILGQLEDLRNEYLAISEIFEEWGVKFANLRKSISDEQHNLDAGWQEIQPIEMPVKNENKNYDPHSKMIGENPRIRSGAYSRQPTAKTDADVLRFMKENPNIWISAVALAEMHADDDVEAFRYLRGSYGRALREGLDKYYKVRRSPGKSYKWNVGWNDEYQYMGGK